MCSAGSSNVNILHPPSHSPVPGPGIPHPSNGRLVRSLFLFLSVSIAHKHTDLTPFLSRCNYFRPAISFLAYLPHTFLHFPLFAGVPFFTLPSFPFLPPIFSPSTTLHRLSLSCSLIYLHSGVWGMQTVLCRASRALLCPSRPGLRFVMLDNTLRCRDKTSAAADKKSLVLSFSLHCLLHFSLGDAEFSGSFLSAREGMKIRLG